MLTEDGVMSTNHGLPLCPAAGAVYPTYLSTLLFFKRSSFLIRYLYKSCCTLLLHSIANTNKGGIRTMESCRKYFRLKRVFFSSVRLC